MVDERCIVNAIVGLRATGGSTVRTLHPVAVAAAAGIIVNWDDFSDLSDVRAVAGADLFQRWRGCEPLSRGRRHLAFLIRELLSAGLLHEDVQTVWGWGVAAGGAERPTSVLTARWRGAMY